MVCMAAQDMDIEDVGKSIDGKWDAVKPIVEKLLISDEISGKLIKYQINTGGRRVRPFFTILFCNAFGGKEEDALYPAAASELIHNASLVVDDVIDDQETRRELLSMPKKFGTNIAWCASVDYCASALAALRSGKRPEEMTTLFIKTLKDMADGQTKDVYYNVLMEKSGNPITESEYVDNIFDRTGSLFVFSCMVGHLSSGNMNNLEKTEAFGTNYGIAFQIANDIKDAFGHSSSVPGKDMIQGKINNIVYLTAMRDLTAEKRYQFIQSIKSNGRDIAPVIDMVSQTNARESAGKLLYKYAREAERNAPQGPEGRIIRAAIDYFFEPFY